MVPENVRKMSTRLAEFFLHSFSAALQFLLSVLQVGFCAPEIHTKQVLV